MTSEIKAPPSVCGWFVDGRVNIWCRCKTAPGLFKYDHPVEEFTRRTRQPLCPVRVQFNQRRIFISFCKSGISGLLILFKKQLHRRLSSGAAGETLRTGEVVLPSGVFWGLLSNCTCACMWESQKPPDRMSLALYEGRHRVT